ncbi:AAA family ATPase [Clostridium paraputrificum]|uniref:DNA polymerase III subunit tau n=1 Tax=Clostridium paraputrificum TaxID=29363 RepID=A0A6N3EZA1_9CLOT
MRLFRFDDVVGNVSTKNILTKSLMSGAFPKLSIFSGSTGIGKSTCAEISAIYLNCENPRGYEPCGQCKACRSSIDAILNNKKGMYVRKINIPSLNNNTNEVAKLIEEVFRLDLGEQKAVFIFEEFHVLNHANQTTLLEELDKIPDNVYVIICTTKASNLLPELKGRAIMFPFASLTPSACRLLIDKECKRLGLHVNQKTKELVLRNSHNVPRVIVNSLEFISKLPNCSEEDLIEFLGDVDTERLRGLLKSSSDMSYYLEQLEELLTDYNMDRLLPALKDYVMECCYLATDISYRESRLSVSDKQFAKSLGLNTLVTVYNELYKLDVSKSTETDIQFIFIRIGGLIRKAIKAKNVDPVADMTAKEKHEESKINRRTVIEESNSFQGNRLTTNKMKDFLDENLHKK